MRTPLRSILTLSLVALGAGLLPAQEFVVANRAAGNITVHGGVDAARRLVVPLPPADARPEPMYVQQVGDEVLVGDRANDRLVRFDKGSYDVLGEIPVGAGVFHMWAGERQLWVANDIDDSASVIDTQTFEVLATVRMPEDLTSQGYKPHDVFVGREFAWVTLLGGELRQDFVVQFSQLDFTEQRRVAVGGDPHLWLDPRNDRLHVLSQETGEVALFDPASLAPLEVLDVPGAHGVFQPAGVDTLLVANIEGEGRMDLLAFDTAARSVSLEDMVSTEVGTAHNIAASPDGRQILVTHSGATSTKVTLFTLRDELLPLPSVGADLRKVAETDADLNPFGLAWVD